MPTTTKGRTSLADAVRATAKPVRFGPRCWFDRMPVDAQEEFLDLRRRYQAGEYGSSSGLEIARRAREYAAERQWFLPSAKEFAAWLRK